MNALIWALAAIGAVAPSPTPSLDVLKRAMDPSPGLTSYVASASLTAELHGIVPVRKTLSGVAYYLEPKHKIVFENVPGALARFKALVSTAPTYDEARTAYSITPSADNGKTSTYVLVPLKPGRRVKNVTLTVDDKAAQLVRAEWSYSGGGQLSVEPAYESVGGFQLPVKESISARFPGYRVDGTLRLSGYRLNVPVAPSVFAGNT